MKTRQDQNSETLIDQGKKVFIYGLYCPLGELRYIGKANDMQKRFYSHMRDSKRKTPLYSWIRSMAKKGQKPEMRLIKETSQGNWEFDEIEAIKTARENGVRLLNLADGGNEPKCSMEVRAKNGKMSHRGKFPNIFRAKKGLGKILNFYIKQGDETKADFIRYVISKVNAIPTEKMAYCEDQYSKIIFP
jgi:hypothetical protein